MVYFDQAWWWTGSNLASAPCRFTLSPPYTGIIITCSVEIIFPGCRIIHKHAVNVHGTQNILYLLCWPWHCILFPGFGCLGWMSAPSLSPSRMEHEKHACKEKLQEMRTKILHHKLCNTSLPGFRPIYYLCSHALAD